MGQEIEDGPIGLFSERVRVYTVLLFRASNLRFAECSMMRILWIQEKVKNEM